MWLGMARCKDELCMEVIVSDLAGWTLRAGARALRGSCGGRGWRGPSACGCGCVPLARVSEEQDCPLPQGGNIGVAASARTSMEVPGRGGGLGQGWSVPSEAERAEYGGWGAMPHSEPGRAGRLSLPPPPPPDFWLPLPLANPKLEWGLLPGSMPLGAGEGAAVLGVPRAESHFAAPGTPPSLVVYAAIDLSRARSLLAPYGEWHLVMHRAWHPGRTLP
mmetsp:Transcript_128215/g.319868  ORF Transcript_128215/g.319868 Transcript_128215/m.319868 type:complete len:219 (-) Transcript_128215:36-692(-)